MLFIIFISLLRECYVLFLSVVYCADIIKLIFTTYRRFVVQECDRTRVECHFIFEVPHNQVFCTLWVIINVVCVVCVIFVYFGVVECVSVHGSGSVREFTRTHIKYSALYGLLFVLCFVFVYFVVVGKCVRVCTD